MRHSTESSVALNRTCILTWQVSCCRDPLSRELKQFFGVAAGEVFDDTLPGVYLGEGALALLEHN